MKIFSIFFLLLFFLLPHRSSAQIKQSLINDFLNDSAVRTGHAGISIYEPATGKYLYNYNADKNFLPSSNVKLFTLYAGLKYLGDSVLSAKVFERNDSVFFQPTGDPTFLHTDFISQPVIDLLSNRKKKLVLVLSKDDFGKYGTGWAWDDYAEDFMPERSRFPIYGNVFSFFSPRKGKISVIPFVFKEPFFGESFLTRSIFGENIKIFRSPIANRLSFEKADKPFTGQQVPFITDEQLFLFPLQLNFLADTIHIGKDSIIKGIFQNIPWQNIYSRPVDSLFRPMMFNSDNFFAEQTLLMVSNEKLGYMTDAAMIDTLLKNDLQDISTKPRWVDGSGLSRYNLFSPKNFIYILDKLKKEFGWERIKNILPTAGQGTLTGYYEGEQGNIYAKTGSMSNNVSLSGYLITKNHHELFFSVIVNNYSGSGRDGRRAIEKFIKEIIKRY